jgi:poly(3-hydroxyalkanoate) depolymerase
MAQAEKFERRASTRTNTPKNYTFRTVVCDGQTLRVCVRPGSSDQTPLLLCNGIGASLELVYPFIEALDPTLEVIAFDVPGVGLSSTPWFPYTFAKLVRTVAKMLDALGYDDVDVAGVSWGGFLAQQFALDHPKRCRRLILAATSTGVLSVPPSPRVLALMASPLRYTNAEHGAKIAPEIYGGVFRDNKELAAAHAKKMGSSGGRGYYYQAFAVYFWTSLYWLHRVKQPTLLLAGNDDPLIPLVNMRVMRALIPNSTLHVVDDGHLFLITQAEAISPVVMGFLQSTPQKSR